MLYSQKETLGVLTRKDLFIQNPILPHERAAIIHDALLFYSLKRQSMPPTIKIEHTHATFCDAKSIFAAFNSLIESGVCATRLRGAGDRTKINFEIISGWWFFISVLLIQILLQWTHVGKPVWRGNQYGVYCGAASVFACLRCSSKYFSLQIYDRVITPPVLSCMLYTILGWR